MSGRGVDSDGRGRNDPSRPPRTYAGAPGFYPANTGLRPMPVGLQPPVRPVGMWQPAGPTATPSGELFGPRVRSSGSPSHLIASSQRPPGIRTPRTGLTWDISPEGPTQPPPRPPPRPRRERRAPSPTRTETSSTCLPRETTEIRRNGRRPR